MPTYIKAPEGTRRSYDKPVPKVMGHDLAVPGRAAVSRPSVVARSWSRNVGKTTLVKVGPRKPAPVDVTREKLLALKARLER
jgi:hypothetical protein